MSDRRPNTCLVSLKARMRKLESLAAIRDGCENYFPILLEPGVKFIEGSPKGSHGGQYQGAITPEPFMDMGHDIIAGRLH